MARERPDRRRLPYGVHDGQRAFASQIAAAREAAGRHPLWVGIGASSLSHEQIMDDIVAARRIGAGGVGLFSYDSLTAPARGSGYLSRLGKAAFSF